MYIEKIYSKWLSYLFQSFLFEYLSILLYFTLLQFYYTKCQCIFVAHFWRNDSKNQNKHKKLRFLSNYKQFKFALNETKREQSMAWCNKNKDNE